MAIGGSLGSFLGLGTAEQFITRLTGSERAGAFAGDISEGISAAGKRGMGTEQGQAVARSQATQTNPQETQESGTTGGVVYNQNIMPAGFANIPQPPSRAQSGFTNVGLPQIFMGGGAILSGAAAVIDLFFTDPITGETKRKKITRKFKSQVKQSVELVGLEETARMLNTEPSIVVQILLKRFRNDGPYITKAAVRKTRATVRKMEQVNMLSKDIAKLAGGTTTRRRSATSARASTSRKTTVIQ